MPTSTQILAAGSTAATSTEFDVEANAFVGVVVIGSSPLGIEIKAPDGSFIPVRGINSGGDNVFTIYAPGTFRLRRAAGQQAAAFITR